MVSSVAGWKDGREVWSVTHDSEETPLHLDIRGEPPAGFAAIRDRLTRQQEEDDGADFIFDIPVALAKEITGYRYDEKPEVAFENLVKPTFLRKFLGR